MIRQKLGIEMKDLFQLDYMATFLDQIPMREMVGKMHNAFEKFQPNEILLPHSCDVHSDHRVCYEVVTACTKRFRCPSIERVMCYEVMSETDQSVNGTNGQFIASYYVDISSKLEEKLEMLRIYKNEIGEHPFPRSTRGIKALATVRGAQMGREYAEAFQLLRSYE